MTFPTFLDQNGNSPIPSNAVQGRRMAALLEAFREGSTTRFADTSAFADSARLSRLPDSATWFFTLSTEPSVHGDSATVEIYGGQAIPYGPIERELLRYEFVREGADWRFVRRSILYAT